MLRTLRTGFGRSFLSLGGYRVVKMTTTSHRSFSWKPFWESYGGVVVLYPSLQDTQRHEIDKNTIVGDANPSEQIVEKKTIG